MPQVLALHTAHCRFIPQKDTTNEKKKEFSSDHTLSEEKQMILAQIYSPQNSSVFQTLRRNLVVYNSTFCKKPKC